MPDHHEEEALGKGYDAHLMRRLLVYLAPYRSRVLGAVGLSIFYAALSAVGPYLFKIAIDDYLVPATRGKLGAAEAMRGVEWVAVAFFAALILVFALQYLQVRLMQVVGQRAMFDLRMEVFGHLQRLPMSFLDRNPVGRLVTRVTTDIDVLNELFASGVVAMLADCFTLVFIVATMMWMDWRLALTAFAVLPLILLVTMLFRRRFRDANRRIRAAIARINAFLQEHISGMTVVQLFNREGRSREKFAKINRDHMLAFKDAIFAHAFFYPAVEVLGVAAVALLLWFGGLRVLAGGVELGVVIAFIQYAQRFFRPIQDLSEKYTILQSAMASSERIFKLLDEPVTIRSPAVGPAESPEVAVATRRERSRGTARLPERPSGEIEFRNVWFRYRPATDGADVAAGLSRHSDVAAGLSRHGSVSPVSDSAGAVGGGAVGASAADDDAWVLRDVSFRVAPGQTVALVGHTGAGKTTIIQLLLRFYDIQRGQILLDGTDIREFDLDTLRRQFGIVLQDPFLFTGSVETNVRLGSDHVTRDDAKRALEEVRLGRFVDSLPGGMDAPVSERGATFSVGQRQLISFARALAHDPRILVLDEATSSVDTQTELLIREALDRLLTGRTGLVIAHRLSTIQRADTILVFHKGRLREQGSHQELLARRGIYFRLYQLQYKDQELRIPVAAGGESRAPLTADD